MILQPVGVDKGEWVGGMVDTSEWVRGKVDKGEWVRGWEGGQE